MVPTTLAHYRILRPIGAGGMGEVYLAEDTKLGRKVALKVLAPGLAFNLERRDRFEREARAVAALSHPNIVTIHSVEQQGDALFLTMELVEGKPLTDLIPRHGMTIERLLEIAIPLADAVAAAHHGGITHRDLKPANVMVSDEGRVKVLDFGLAKLREDSPHDGEAATAAAQLTREGDIVGTCAYMSPEQAHGRTVDPRSDIFSIGILLYELATGERPFKGESQLSVLTAIVTDTPPSVTELRQDLPDDLARILRRCLAKDPEARYQTARDLRAELIVLRRNLESNAVRPALPSTAVSRPRWWSVAAASIIVVVIGLIAAASWPYLRRPEPFASIAMRRLTNTGNVGDAAISPDGRYVVQLVDPLEAPSIWIRQVSSASNVQIVPPMQGAVGGLAFTPDGESVLYLFRPPKSVGSLYKVPLLGGPPRKLVDDVDTVPAFSPDGTRMAFLRRQSPGKVAMILASADGTNERSLASRQSPSDFQNKRLAWSPDGTQIAAFAGMMPWQRSRIVLVDVNTGKDRDLTEPRFDFPGQLAWLPDGRALVFNAVERANGRVGSTGQLWIASYPEGVVRRITSDIANYSTLAATRDGATLAAVQGDERAGLWVVPNGDVARARPITAMSAGRDGWSGFDWTSDGRVVYTSMTQGTWDLWVTDAKGGPPHQLTSVPGVETNPRIMPDGKTVVYIARPAGDDRFHIHTIDVDGANAREIPIDGALPGFVQVAAGSVYFVRSVNGVTSLHRMPLAGGASEMVFRDPAKLPRSFGVRLLSEDGKWAVGTAFNPNAAGLQLMLVPLDQSQPPRTFPFPLRPSPEFKFAWAPAGDAFDVLALRDGVSNVWRFPLDGRAPSQVTAFTTPSEILTGFAWSRDGMLAVSRATQSSDVVLISNQR